MIRIVERYIFGSFLTAFLFAFVILSAVLSIGGLGNSVHCSVFLAVEGHAIGVR